MTATTPPASVPAELELDATERAALSAWHVVLLRAADPRDGARIGRVVADLLQDLGESGAARAGEFLADLRGTHPGMRPAEVDRRTAAFAAAVCDRSRSLLVLIDLCLAARDVPGLRGRTARGILRRAADALPGLRPDDVDRVQQEIARTIRRMRLRTIRAGRAAGVAIGGAVLGVAAAGVAAPVVAGLVVAGTGLSGAAATSAGLAALGGGSLASGGAGIAGGMLVLNTVGAALGFGAGAAGSRIGGFSAGEIEAAAVRLAVATRLVLRAEQDDDEAARRVVLALQQRIAAVVVQLEELATRLRETDEENRWLRDELRRDQERCRRLQGVLQGALDRLADDDQPGSRPLLEAADDDSDAGPESGTAA